jgi:hypothetical protein
VGLQKLEENTDAGKQAFSGCVNQMIAQRYASFQNGEVAFEIIAQGTG